MLSALIWIWYQNNQIAPFQILYFTCNTNLNLIFSQKDQIVPIHSLQTQVNIFVWLQKLQIVYILNLNSST